MAAIRITKLSRASLAGAVLLITAGLLLSATQARAETEKGRLVLHSTKYEQIEVGDMPGHLLGVGEEKGLVFYENGEVATVSSAGTWDSPSGKGSTQQGYDVLTFEDGSTRVVRWKGTSTFDEEKKIYLYEGTFTFVQGTGRFEGIKGSGSSSGKFFPGFAAYIDFTGTYTLP